jgi:LysR family transcriptional regulator, hypochlorite-specific transcription factor HypT
MRKQEHFMDLALFDDVLVLLEEGNMSRAARRRNVTQPAFSRRIRSFENWLGRPIVTRTTNRVEIAPALLQNAAELQALVGHVRELRGRIAGFDPGQTTLTITAQHSLMVSALPDFVMSAQRHFSKIAFRARAANHNDCISLFLSGEAALLMCYEREGDVELPFGSSVVRSLWGRDRLVPVVGGPLRFSVLDNGRVPEMAPMIRYPAGSFFAEMLDRGATAYSQHRGGMIAETAFTAGIKAMAVAGLGVAWLPMSLIYAEVQSGALTVCNEDNDMLQLRISLFARPTNSVAVQLCEGRQRSARLET